MASLDDSTQTQSGARRAFTTRFPEGGGALAQSLSAAQRSAIAARAVAAAVSVASEQGIVVREPVVLADRYAIRVHLRPAPVVARVSTFTSLLRVPIEPWLARELAVSTFLHHRGAPVVPPSELLPPGPHLRDGFAISFWSYCPPVSEEVPAPETTGRMLAELHQVLAEYGGELPMLAPPLRDIPNGLDRLENAGDILPANDVSMLRRLAERLLPIIADESRQPTQPLHGDAHSHNLIHSAQGLLWNDFEDTCRGPIAWDLSTLADIDGRMLSAYPNAPPASALEIFRQVRLLHGAVWVFALLPEVGEWAMQARAILDVLRDLA